MLTPKTVFGALLIVASSCLSAPALAGAEASNAIK
jgi:hypothetical protein